MAGIGYGRNLHVPGICTKRTCYLMFEKFCIAELTEEKNDAGEISWVIKVRWKEWEASGKEHIPGINEDLHLDEYVRQYVPYVVEQRTVSDNRVNGRQMLKDVGLTWNDRFEFMCRTRGTCGNNRLYIGRTPTDFTDYDEWIESDPSILN